MPARRFPSATLVALALVALSCSACGRRGALQPPGSSASTEPTSTTQKATPGGLPQGIGLSDGAEARDPDAVRDGDELAVSATPAGGGTEVPVTTSRGAKRGYTIPKEPFILDPIL